jgi:hypothetical protein
VATKARQSLAGFSVLSGTELLRIGSDGHFAS